MPKYEVVIDYRASLSYSVEAASEDEAIEMAKQIESADQKDRVWDSLEFVDAWVSDGPEDAVSGCTASTRHPGRCAECGESMMEEDFA